MCEVPMDINIQFFSREKLCVLVRHTIGHAQMEQFSFQKVGSLEMY